MKKLLAMMFMIIFSISFSEEKLVGIREFDGKLRFGNEFEKIILIRPNNFAIIIGKSEIYTVYYDVLFHSMLFKSGEEELTFEKATTFIGRSSFYDIYKVREDIGIVLMTVGMGKEFQVTNPRLIKEILENDFSNSNIDAMHEIINEVTASHIDKQIIYMEGIIEGREN
ncbi:MULTISPECIES: hypothetical protein [Psychrilyobacter]|uniref:Uncharacterized protein n=1 Tax=Psychrilyobacter piezotolerans TaxID=2293438 RepID=A0ABX9KI60_9FUSO|nr:MULTISPECIES: hypothetical protein [Psychrilyobacter]MCS5423100.1 hypothetical protein [Psychrilyobacter sp. S5]NDI77902.1 hypothetical protein [Psychrilyobacter piezotolerans]RDE62020.1 hypothetical protein DV867_07470 [Psychrilyobacter sp. S5]REI41267.1 hypothetical protein DYH56_07470 [Psychrilyobacter piezotolerans]